MAQLGVKELGTTDIGGSSATVSGTATASISAGGSIFRSSTVAGTADAVTTTATTDYIRRGTFVDADLLDRLPKPLRREPDAEFRQFIDVLQSGLNDYDERLVEIIASHQITNAGTVADLEQIGAAFGPLGRRRGRELDAYRQYLLGLAESFNGRGTVPGIRFAVAAGVRASPESIAITEDYPVLEYSLQLTDWEDHRTTTVRDLADLADASVSELAGPVDYRFATLDSRVEMGEMQAEKSVEYDELTINVSMGELQHEHVSSGLGSGVLGDGTPLGPDS